ncbi:putative metacaspase [Lanmaoa asiatica]|nr:putative metacaspase [Lanmaoa asiatica]
MWDMRGNYAAQEPMSSHPRFPGPVPLNPKQAAPTYPAPFIPLGLPTAPPPRRRDDLHFPFSSVSYNTFPRSAIIPQVSSGISPPRGAPGPPPRVATPRPVPVYTPSHHHSSHHNNSHRNTRHHSHSVSAATSRHVHYADEISQPRSRQISARSSHVPGLAQAVPVATTSRYLHPNITQKSIQGHRRRAHSTGAVTAPVAINFMPSQSQQQVRATGGHQYSRCTGRKKALCIGINYLGQKRELRGCINDIKNVKRFLTRQWGFKEGDIVMLMDQTTNPRQMPTRKNVLDAMRWLVKDAKPHDSLFFHYSGHGGQIPDTHGDKTDGFDEVIYPVDYKTAGVIIDDAVDRFRITKVKTLPRGCRLTVRFYAFSGVSIIYHHDGQLKENHIAERTRSQRMSTADVISFAACRDDQTSADTVQGGVAVGAMSYVSGSHLPTRKPIQSYLELLLSIRDIVQPHYQQKAQLSSGHYIDTSLRFIL